MKNTIELNILSNMDADHLGSILCEVINKLEENKDNVISIRSDDGASLEEVHCAVGYLFELLDRRNYQVSIECGYCCNNGHDGN